LPENDALIALRAFWTAMFDREVRFYRELRAGSGPEHSARVFALAEEAREEIFARHCTPKKRATSQGAPLGDLPAYDPEAERVDRVVAESARQTTVYTAKALFGAGDPQLRRYFLLRRRDTWLVDRMEAYDDAKEAWARRAL